MEKTNISTENAKMEQLKEQFNDRMMKLITIVTVDNFNERMSDAGDSEIVNDMLEAVKDMADTVYKYRRAKSEILSEGPCDCVNDEMKNN